MKKTIWLNLDETKVDVTYLDKRFSEKGYIFIKQTLDNTAEMDIATATIEMGKKADAIISIWEPWNEQTLSAVKDNVKFIVRYGVGMDNIDIPSATKYGIPVANIPSANSLAVAEVALLHILNAGRRFTQCVEGGKKRIWPSTIIGNELEGKTLGLIGFGNIAKQLVRLLTGFEIKILVYDVFVDKTVYNPKIEFVQSIQDVFSRSDIVSLHIPLTNETKGMINKQLLNLMKPSAYLINTCRGGVTNEADLIEVLKNKKIRGAGLDVLTKEPPATENPLFDMENVFITSHMGAASLESEHRSQIVLANSIDSIFNGILPENVKNKEVWKNNYSSTEKHAVRSSI